MWRWEGSASLIGVVPPPPVIAPPIPQTLTNSGRLAELHRSGLLGTRREDFFDNLTSLAVQLLGVPTVAFSLVDAKMQFIKSAAGEGNLMSPGWDSLEGCLCPEVVRRAAEVVVSDTILPGETPESLTVRAYAGVPLVTHGGHVLGALCALDSQPRQWTEHDMRVLRVVGESVMAGVQHRMAERTVHDIQLRLVADRTLAHSVQQQMPVGFIVAEIPSGRLVSVNAQMTEIFRTAFKPAADLSGYREFVGFREDGTQLAPQDWPLARTVLRQESVRGEEIQIRRGDGTQGFIRMSSNPVRDSAGTVVAAVGIVLDVTEQRRAERSVRASDERYRLVARATNDVIWDWDLPSNSLVWNDGVEKVFGYQQTEITPSVEWWVSNLHPDDKERVTAGLHGVLDHGGTGWSDQYRYRRRDGTYATVIDRGYVSRDASGAAIRMIGAMTDVTERSRAEAAIRFQAQLLNAVQQAVVATDTSGGVIFWNRFAENLYGWTAEEAIGRKLHELTPAPFMRDHAAEILERTAAGGSWTGEFLVQGKSGKSFPALLTTSPFLDGNGSILGLVGVSIDLTERRSLEEQFRQSQKMDAVGRLAGGIAHDFNNLLTVIHLNTEIIIEGFDASDPRAEDIRQIRSAADRASALTRQLLAFSRKQILQPRVLDLNTVVTSLEPMLRRLIGEDITIASIQQARGYVVADPGQLEQVLVNLVVNSRDAMPSGGRISIETMNTELDESYASEHSPVISGRYISLTVSDNGVGMTKDTVEHAFDPFFTTKEAGKGTGLGLATVYGIVKQSGGYVWIYSEPGEGTTIKVYLPEVSAAAAFTSAGDGAALTVSVPRGSETILLVEDEDAVRGLASRILEKQGYRILVAANGREAMEIATREEGRIELVLTDIVMPGINGRALVEKLSGVRPSIKSLYMSGYTDDDIVRRGFIEPSRAFLQKPFTSEALVRTVRKVLDEG